MYYLYSHTDNLLLMASWILSSFPFLQIAPTYLASCQKQGLGLLEKLLYMQPVQHYLVLLKVTTNHVLQLFSHPHLILLVLMLRA